MIDFSLSPDLIALQKKVEGFVREEIIPFERDPRQTEHGPTEALRQDLVARARMHGLVSPHASRELGGLGLDHRSKAVVFEAAGYSTLGPLAMNIHAPDEGNIHLLELIANPAQKERYLEPLVRAETRSIFCMTEPDGGAGSDPSLLKTVAQPDGDGWVVNGRKWLITGAGGNGAGLLLVMAKTLDARGKDLGASLFVAPTDHPGYKFTRQLDTIDSNAPGGHAVVDFTDMRLRQENVLGEIGKGFRYAQMRLGPARLTHCMRWLGAARRCHDIAVQAAKGRHAFGKTLIEHEGVGFQLADNEIDLHLSRLAIWQAAWLLDTGAQARTETSMAKVFCSEACSRVVDRSLQTMGGLGVTMDTVVGRIYRDIRPFRIYDGPSEVHRFAIARRLAGKDREPQASP
jgi:acyl-CoA dehydrogenase